LILARLRQHRLFEKLSKCELNRASLTVLGHFSWSGWCGNSTEQGQSSDEWPSLTTVTEVQSFRCLENYYRRFIRYYARISHPLSELTKKGFLFELVGEDRRNVFRPLKMQSKAPQCCSWRIFQKRTL
jgi:hypothetical protein